MTLLQVDNLTKHYGAETVLRGVGFYLRRHEKVGLIGPNGSGKSTLFDILAGLREPDEGSVNFYGDFEVGYLTQDIEPDMGDDNTVWEEGLRVFSRLRQMERRMGDLEEKMGKAAGERDVDSLVQRYGEVRDRYERLGGYDYESRTRRILAGLGFSSDGELRQKVGSLSGGQRVRLALAKLLLSSPEFLLLDEPTNHLDLSAREFLEEYLHQFPGAVLVISHDRYFLDSVVERILEMNRGQISIYEGNYSFYEREKEERYQRRLEEYQQQQERIEEIKAFIRRYRAGQRSQEAKSRQKMLDRMDRIEKPPPPPPEMNLTLNPRRRSGREVCRVENLGKAFPAEGFIFRHFDTTVFKGDRIAIVGPNGSGKTTLLRTLLGRECPDEGTVEWGHGVDIGYFDQELAKLDEENTVLREIRRDSELNVPQARQLLGGFLFSGDDVYKRVADLSGGEKTRLLLAKLEVQRANVLALDEPTNNLDIVGRQTLQDVLQEFAGTFFLITHDRYFLQELVTQIWEVSACDSDVVIYRGDYKYYKRKAETRRTLEESKRPGKADSSPGKREKRENRSGEGSKSAEREAERIERRIAKLERRLNDLEEKMSDPANYEGEELGQLAQTYENLEKELAELYGEWEETLQ